MNLRDAALRYLQIDPQRVRVISENQAVPISEMKKGIIFVWATWSGAAQLAIKALGKALSLFPDLDDLHLYIVDNDAKTTEGFMSSIGDVPSGAGETFWVGNGAIQSKLAKYSDKDVAVLQERIKALLIADSTS